MTDAFRDAGWGRHQLGDGARWDARTGELLWVDILRRRVRAVRPNLGAPVRTYKIPSPVGCLTPLSDPAAGWIVAAGGGFGHLTRSGAWTWLLAVEEGSSRLRMNDGACDPRGRFLAGTLGPQGCAALYMVDIDGGVSMALNGLTASNGLGWSPDGATAYLVDSGPSTITTYDYDIETGGFGASRPFAQRPPSGTFDGLTVDADGCVWVALWDGSRVQRYSPQGILLDELPVPAARPTSVCLGGSDLGTAFVTTAFPAGTPGLLDGHVLEAGTSAHGIPVTAYAGPFTAGSLEFAGPDRAGTSVGQP